MAGPNVVRDMGDTLVHLLQAAIPPLVPAANIKLSTPSRFEGLDAPLAPPTITIFLYRITVNPTMRNGPRRCVAGGGTTRPLMPIELRYLITPWANETGGEHTIAGHILQALYDRTELGPADLRGDSWSDDDSVQLVLDDLLSTEEYYQIWSNAQLPYRLSLTYLARIVGIEPTETVTTAPVVSATFTGGGP